MWKKLLKNFFMCLLISLKALRFLLLWCFCHTYAAVFCNLGDVRCTSGETRLEFLARTHNSILPVFQFPLSKSLHCLHLFCLDSLLRVVSRNMKAPALKSNQSYYEARCRGAVLYFLNVLCKRFSRCNYYTTVINTLLYILVMMIIKKIKTTWFSVFSSYFFKTIITSRVLVFDLYRHCQVSSRLLVNLICAVSTIILFFNCLFSVFRLFLLYINNYLSEIKKKCVRFNNYAYKKLVYVQHPSLCVVKL